MTLLLSQEKEIFLREQIVSVYLFAAKIMITLASATLALSVGIQGLLEKSNHYELVFLLLSGWGFILISIVLTACAVKTGLETLYDFLNNLRLSKPEITNDTEAKEKILGSAIVNSFISYIIGVLLILAFISVNFLI